ncbi:hypothetical protein OH77DRAFT_878848 [Trametes cingulata]|nr:hypothetical protein OH77DRAFT_878848 [Trametes cingulata]
MRTRPAQPIAAPLSHLGSARLATMQCSRFLSKARMAACLILAGVLLGRGTPPALLPPRLSISKLSTIARSVEPAFRTLGRPTGHHRCRSPNFYAVRATRSNSKGGTSRLPPVVRRIRLRSAFCRDSILPSHGDHIHCGFDRHFVREGPRCYCSCRKCRSRKALLSVPRIDRHRELPRLLLGSSISGMPLILRSTTRSSVAFGADKDRPVACPRASVHSALDA